MTEAKKMNEKKHSDPFILREALPEDDGPIRTLIRSISMYGPVSMTTDCDPSFFDAVEIEGHEKRIIVAQSGRRITGVATMARRCVFLDGKPAEIGHIGNLRLDESIRGGSIIKGGTHYARKLHDDVFRVPLYVCGILKDNLAARKVLTSGRFGLPQSREIGRLYNASIPLLKRRQPKPPNGIRVVRGDVAGASRIAGFLNSTGRGKQFFPVYTSGDIAAGNGMLRGGGPEDFYIALKDDHILGVMACWNQLPFRRMMVTGYSGYMRWLKPAVAFLANLLNMAPIPDPGHPFQNVFAAGIAIENDDPVIFKLLLDSILYKLYDTGKTFFTVGLMECDPLLPVLQKYLHFPIHTCVYAVSWNGLDHLNRLDGRCPYIESASL